jgi:hypothetical protein
MIPRHTLCEFSICSIPALIQSIEGTNIDRPSNALTLSVNLHRSFGTLKVYFEADPDFQNRYIIKTTDHLMFRVMLPVTQDLFIASDHNIDLPMPRLLAIHRACCLIVHLSGAGEYIDKVPRDMEELGVRVTGQQSLAV